jgi:hypothetical protein
MAHGYDMRGLAMGRFPTWAKFTVVAAAGLLSPVLAFLMAMAVECSIGVIRDLGALPLVALIVIAAIGRSLIRKARARPQDSAAIET